MKKQKAILLFLLLFFIVDLAFAQQNILVTGIVRSSEDNEPLAGVSVTQKGNSSVGAVTNIDGKYSLSVSSGARLIFSYVGMESREITADRNVIDVTLIPNTNLDEVVVVGYGTLKKRDLSGSVGQIKTDDMLKGNPAASINNALQGRLAGVVVNQNDGAPGAGVSIFIRGTNSFSTNSQPLYILDGIPYDIASAPTSSLQNGNNQTSNPLGNINPNDIESIEVLKDASATAIYGSRGANGVILITTKKGKKGVDKIEFTSNFGVSKIGKRIDVLDPVTYAKYVNEGVLNREKYDNVSYYNLPYPGIWSYRYDANNNMLTNTGVYEPSPEDFLNPGLRTDQYGNQTMISSTDWQDEIFQTGYSQEYNLSTSGGSDKGWYSFSGNYLKQNGIIINSGYERYSFRSNIGRTLRNWLDVGLNISYTRAVTDFSKTNSSEAAVIRSALVFPPTYDPDFGAGQNNQLDWLAANPSVYVRNAKDQLLTNNAFAASYVELKFTDYLKFRENIGVNYSGNNRYSYYNRLTHEGYPPTNGRGAQSDNWYLGITSESLLAFEKIFNKIHSINAVAGYTYEVSNYGNKTMSGSDFPTDITQAYDMSQALRLDPLQSGRGQTSLISMLGRVNYTYDGKYILTTSVRRDGSSKFIEGNKYATFASGAVAWRLSEEKFIKNLNLFNNLKLRLSYGQTGNQGINAYQTQAFLATANYPIAGSLNSGFAEVDWRGALNPDLKWETTDQYNAGLDFSFLKDRIGFTVDLYYKKTTDLLQNVKIESNSGFTSMWQNSGWVENRGMEITGKFYPVMQRDFTWTIDANLSFNKNKIGGLEGDQFATRLWYAVDNVFIQRNGMPIGAIYGYVEDGFYDNIAEVRADPQYADETKVPLQMAQSKIGEIKYRDIDSDGQITDADRVIIGNTNPDFVFGFTNNFKYKSFDFGFFFQGSVGNDIFNANLTEIKMTNIANVPVDAYQTRWTEENRENAKWPKAISGGYTREWKLSNRYIEDGSYVRLKNVNAGYTFKPKLKGIESIHIYVSATNLFTITDYGWYDPDVNAFAGDASRRGVDLYSYPSSRTYSLGLKLDF
ncbi:MAG: TonB-dependent receptor [Dysgonamonadaceae bacterium]|nr:TonB-dependent receptor [Dysgonamonadaceae bacterium]